MSTRSSSTIEIRRKSKLTLTARTVWLTTGFRDPVMWQISNEAVVTKPTSVIADTLGSIHWFAFSSWFARSSDARGSFRDCIGSRTSKGVQNSPSSVTRMMYCTMIKSLFSV